MSLSRKITVLSLLAGGFLTTLFTLASQPLHIAKAAATLTISQITWSVIGLDANDVNAGPNEFPAGARICNTGDADTEGNVTVTWAFTTSNDHISLVNQPTQTLDPLGPTDCADVYYTVRVTRNASSYDATRDYTITATSGSANVNTGQRLVVKKLTPGSDSTVTALNGPTDLKVGDSDTWSIVATTPDAGYPELEAFLTLCADIFHIDQVSGLYDVPNFADTNILWADGCAWDTQGNSGCTATTPENHGGEVSFDIDATIIGTGSCTLHPVYYDFSSDAYHYNADYSQFSLVVNATSAGSSQAATPVRTPTPQRTPTGVGGPATRTPTPGPSPTPRPGATAAPEQLPGTGSRLHPSMMLPTLAPIVSDGQKTITIAIIITLMLGVALAAWSVMLSSGILPKDSETSHRVRRALSLLFIVSALIVAGMLMFNLARATQVGGPPPPQSHIGRPAEGYLPPDIPATHIIIPQLKINTTLTEAPRLGNSWDVSQFYDEIAHLDGTAFPGTNGNAVLAGHVHHTKGVGPFWNLKSLTPGNIIVARGEGVEYRYRVDWVKVIDPSEVDVLSPSTQPELTIISCSDWNAAQWTYVKRLVVHAKFFDRARIEITPTPFATATVPADDIGAIPANFTPQP